MDKLKNLWDATLAVAIVTILAYATAIIYQASYFRAFGIDIRVVGVSISPDDFFLPSIMLIATAMVAVIAYGSFRLVLSLPKYIKGIEYFSHDLVGLALFGVCVYVVLFDFNFSKAYGISQSASDTLVGAVFWLLVIIAVHISYQLLFHVFKKRKESAFKSYIRSRKSNAWVARTGRYAALNKFYFLYLVPVAGIFFMVTVGADRIATENAKSTRDFIMIVDPKKGDITRLVIGKSGSGLLVKIYDVKNKKFREGFEIIEPQNLSYSEFSIQE